MISLRNVTLKNFLSVGAVPQTIELQNIGLTLVLGENLDLGGGGSRNGVGKTSLISAICYALYGQPLTNIKKDNLTNAINKKNMSVSIEFECNGNSYRIERGRRPNFFKYIVNDQYVNEDNNDEAQGENRDTQAQIDQILGISHTMFRHVVALNTYTEPFLSLGAGKQREIIEELLGITQLSQKADKLKELIKATRNQIEQEEFRIATVKKSNDHILGTIREFEQRISRWHTEHEAMLEQTQQALSQLSEIDINLEIEHHRVRTERNQADQHLRTLVSEMRTKRQHHNQLKTQQDHLLKQYIDVQNHTCAMCGQNMHDSKQAEVLNDLEIKITKLDRNIQTLETEIATLDSRQTELQTQLRGLPQVDTVYRDINSAYEHKNSLNQLENSLDRLQKEVNPYVDQAASLNNTLQEVDYANVNSLTTLREHQEFLLKLLVNKDSFIRKKIIDQNLAYLNHRLKEYLLGLSLPHQVKFNNDLSVEIAHMGQDFDFDNLSRGERTRVILSLSWAFRDIFENMNQPIDFLSVDEILDQGLDPQGLERSLEILKGMSRDRGKNILLISHRDELIPRCTRVLSVIKEDGYSRFEWGWEQDMV